MNVKRGKNCGSDVDVDSYAEQNTKPDRAHHVQYHLNFVVLYFWPWYFVPAHPSFEVLQATRDSMKMKRISFVFMVWI
jgi:hypothetical protein